MKPFPPVEVLSWMVGQEISAISFGPYQLDIFLSDGDFVTVETAVSHSTATDSEHRYTCQDRSGGLEMGSLLARKIAGLRRLSDDQMALELDNGVHLTLHTVIGPYESGHFSQGGKLTVF